MADPPSPVNAGYDWDSFDSDAYLDHYYCEPHPDDDRLMERTCAFLRDAAPAGAALEVVDVGTGPNLFPLLAALPVARGLTAWEYSAGNVAWLRAELRRPEPRWQWAHYWGIAARAYPGEDPDAGAALARLAERATIRQASIFDLPEAGWDAATMFFCAESITRDAREFAHACACFARAARPGGLLAAAFLSQSEGYEVEGRYFPAVRIDADRLAEVFAPHAENLSIEPVGIVEEEVRKGYTGALFLNGRRRA